MGKLFSRAKKTPRPFVSAVVVSAGEGRRMGGIDKQRAPIDDIPVVVRSVSQFEECPLIDEIILVCPEELIADYYRIVQDYGLEKVASVVGGGIHRQDSVFRGIDACSEDAAFFAIHDGARPLVTRREIEGCLAAAIRYGAAAAGVPSKDTIKIRDEEGFVHSTPDRDQLAAIQTPQTFAAGIYREAMARARRDHCVYTDDCQLVERCGHRVFVSQGSYENLKITTPEDLVIAQAIIDYRERGEIFR